jgi:hypothetical protein
MKMFLLNNYLNKGLPQSAACPQGKVEKVHIKCGQVFMDLKNDIHRSL